MNCRLIEQVEIRDIPVDVAKTLLLAEQRTLTVYDASYLCLSIRRGVALVTLDQPLAKAAQTFSSLE